MLLIDYATHVVYEVSNNILSNLEGDVTAIDFQTFEDTARSYTNNILFRKDMLIPIHAKSLVFVKLKDAEGYVWASRVKVKHNGELPVDCDYLGTEFLFVWPVPMAINAFLNFKERARRNLSSQEFVRLIDDHPPSMEFVPKLTTFGGNDLETIRILEAKDQTVAQRLFVASLALRPSPFAVRARTDRWCQKLLATDRVQFNTFAHSTNKTVYFLGPRSHLSTCKRGKTMDLPDDILARILGFVMSENMQTLKALRNVVGMTNLVSVQFRTATQLSISQMLLSISHGARSLLGNTPMSPVKVQQILNASRLTLRSALVPKLTWHKYIEMRLLNEKKKVPNCIEATPLACQRLLWNI
tara:strand:- start:88 stop:1155 length:1068 start_codon:yes stop_codon:yes gene_type:complete